MPAPLIVFDLDGTLVDTAPDLVETLNTILMPEGVPPIAYHEARKVVGAGARIMIKRAFALHDMICDDTNLERLFNSYLDHYAEHLADQSQPFPGVEQTLDELAAQGFRLAVCTNKLEGLAKLLLDRLNLTQRFDFICGQDTFGVPKPDPTPLLRTISASNASRDRAVMIGDSATDVRTARAAKIGVVAVDFGYSDVPASELGADRLVSRFAELPDAVTEVLGRVKTA